MRLYPKFEIPARGISPARYLRSLVRRGALLRWKSPLPEKIRKRLDEELECAEAKDACEYFLLVADLVKAVKAAGILIGPGRGLATHSAICYALGITDVDPICHQLKPTHFLGRNSSFPDVDLEIDSWNRPYARDYLIQKYGAQNVAHLEWKGQSFHPTALVLASRPIAEIVPSSVVKTHGHTTKELDVVQANVTAQDSVNAGLLKLDFVPNRWLTLIDRTLTDVAVNHATFVDNIPLDDPEALMLLYTGDTEGVYFYSDQQVAALVQGECWETFDEMMSYYLDLRKMIFKLPYHYSKGHHIAFALLAYRMAWVKAHFRRNFDEQYRQMVAEGWKFE